LGQEGFWKQYTARRITRRRALSSAVAGGAALGAWSLVGCSGGGDDNGGGGGDGEETPSIEQPQDGSQDGPAQPGGILRVRQNPALPSMNVFGPGILVLAQGLFLGFTVFDHLWYVPTDTGVRENFLATKVEQPDATTVIATIGDATFHNKAPVNGREVRGSDVVASFKKFADQIPIGFSWLQHVMQDIAVEASDSSGKTIKITQNFPWAWIFTSSNSGSPLFTSILPEEILEDGDLLARDAIGSGHWILDSHENGANVKLRRFDKFRTFQNGQDITGQPFLNGVDFRYIADENAARAAFLDGQIDVTGFSSRKQMMDTADQLQGKIRFDENLSRDYSCLMMRYTEPYTDERVRKAFNRLINRDEMITFLNDGDAVKCGPIPPAHTRYALPEDDPAMQDYFRTDVQEAVELLNAASFDFDKEYELKHSNRPVDSDLAEVLKGQMAEGGVKLKLVQEDLVKWFSQTLNQSQFDMTCFQHLPYEDPDLPLRFYMAPNDPRFSDLTNFMQYRDEEVNDVILAAAQELDEELRVEKVFEAQKTVMRKFSPMINLFSRQTFGGSYLYVKGGITGRGSYGLFNRTTWLDDAQRRQET
jgi:peptide/nickel transport system substrate-binding protein